MSRKHEQVLMDRILEQVLIYRVLKQVGRTSAGSHFKQPVPVDTIPGYLDVVKKPMDFSTVASHVREDAYSSLGELLLQDSLQYCSFLCNCFKSLWLHLKPEFRTFLWLF